MAHVHWDAVDAGSRRDARSSTTRRISYHTAATSSDRRRSTSGQPPHGVHPRRAPQHVIRVRTLAWNQRALLDDLQSRLDLLARTDNQQLLQLKGSTRRTGGGGRRQPDLSTDVAWTMKTRRPNVLAHQGHHLRPTARSLNDCLELRVGYAASQFDSLTSTSYGSVTVGVFVLLAFAYVSGSGHTFSSF